MVKTLRGRFWVAPSPPAARNLWHRLGVARVVLLAAGAVVAVLFLAAWLTGQADRPPLRINLLLPLLGGLIGLTRVRRAHIMRPPRSVVVYGLMCVALIAWGLSGLWLLAASVMQAAATPFPSLGDFGFIEGGLLWTAAIWILYEGVTLDFLSEVEANAFLLSWMFVATLFVLSVAGGADLLDVIKMGAAPSRSSRWPTRSSTDATRSCWRGWCTGGSEPRTPLSAGRSPSSRSACCSSTWLR
jgi:hypothetical protein